MSKKDQIVSDISNSFKSVAKSEIDLEPWLDMIQQEILKLRILILILNQDLILKYLVMIGQMRLQKKKNGKII